MDERINIIKMKELTFKELINQIYNYSEWNNLKIELFDINNNIIKTDEDVKKEFKNNQPTFKIILTKKTKIIKNALVIMIAISEYIDNKKWINLDNIKDIDIKNFKYLFKQELNYDFIYNEKSNMDKIDVQEFMDELFINSKLRRNINNYDALIMIISGHGDIGNVLITSEGDKILIDEIQSLFDCNRMKSFQDFPKIFIIDIFCNDNNIKMKGKDKNNIHNDNGFLTIWSKTKGYQVSNLSLFSETMKNIISLKYKNGYSLNQMLKEIQENIQKKDSDKWYCVQSEDTTDYEIIFQQRKSM
ncbi:transcription factor with AP2 domain(s) [Reticulomyxa filosa]|uniref:Transcription factor with AP2 domain(S) n=1 Tax=Reticulomyxa filosa TaxID=46433 RepID=X6LTZ9_RETFI|nr:transcription factor with AP2 domain(s) [Reticulomyxa filosa]|eukprot:ETO04846.1 transcription factor with AP2 domain(s) [Reticulomyxa filosa]